ncbi:hypothetical protein [Escherichia coli]|uniref:hypothetical protein n=1 Tax=Escherichia coli TaxID=562 RepID=UPI002487D900|nr:hypothetical protein [Escherichia coli]MED6536268.1 hypothetical protein [Escherichia coli O157]MED6562244.1 hypothetical protein [Escherichia coli O157]MED6572968.1 hypothetical protein [Escherichia coli O157]MED6826926.1 hypothetical protein [Escherichia coli O157]
MKFLTESEATNLIMKKFSSGDLKKSASYKGSVALSLYLGTNYQEAAQEQYINALKEEIREKIKINKDCSTDFSIEKLLNMFVNTTETPRKEDVGLGHVSDFMYAAYESLVQTGIAKSVIEVHRKFEEGDEIRQLVKDKENKIGRLFVIKDNDSSSYILINTDKTFNYYKDLHYYMITNYGISYLRSNWEVEYVFYFNKHSHGSTRTKDLYEQALMIATPNENGIFSKDYDKVLERLKHRASCGTMPCDYSITQYNKNYHCGVFKEQYKS